MENLLDFQRKSKLLLEYALIQNESGWDKVGFHFITDEMNPTNKLRA